MTPQFRCKVENFPTGTVPTGNDRKRMTLKTSQNCVIFQVNFIAQIFSDCITIYVPYRHTNINASFNIHDEILKYILIYYTSTGTVP